MRQRAPVPVQSRELHVQIENETEPENAPNFLPQHRFGPGQKIHVKNERIKLCLSKYFAWPRYYCVKCGASYKQKRNLWRHTKYECGVEEKFLCSFCPKKFKRKSVLIYHRNSVHKNMY